MGFLKCHRCGWCGNMVTKAGKVFSEGTSMEFSGTELENAVTVNGECCENEARARSEEYDR